MAQAHFGSDLGKKASELYAQLDININKVQSDYEKTNWFFQLFSDLENDRNEKLETLVNNDKSLLFMAGSHLVMVSAFIEAEDAAKAISDPVKRQQMLDGLAKAWEFAKENPGAAGLEGISAIIKGTVEDAWNVTSHTVESIAQNALGEDPLDAGLASSAALVAAIAFINPIRKATKAAKALLKRAKEARRVSKIDLNKLSKSDLKSYNSYQKLIREHQQKIDDFKANPTVRPGMEKLPADAIKNQQELRIRHLEREITGFEKNINDILGRY